MRCASSFVVLLQETMDNVEETHQQNDPSSSSSPTPTEIISLAIEMGYKVRREEVSKTLFFEEISPDFGMPPCLINIYYTTRSIMTYLNHPSKKGSNELWRSNAYDDIDELRKFFVNPRIHSGKGYRNANKAVRGCVKCGEMKQRTEFSINQWKNKGPDLNKCKNCCDIEKKQRESATGAKEEDSPYPVLSMDNLRLHNDNNNTTGSNRNSNNTKKKNSKTTPFLTDRMERRQFNCPECPKHGRGKYVFFKKVPVTKPICKCPQCKKVTRGKCKRLYAIPKGNEKGYGLYKCNKCGDKWGSSRAISNCGQQCHNCDIGGIESFIRPFRIEIPKTKKSYYKGNAPRTTTNMAGMKRVPKESIPEDQADERQYDESDRRRHNNNDGDGGFVGGGDGSGGSSSSSYDIVKREECHQRSACLGEIATIHAYVSDDAPVWRQHGGAFEIQLRLLQVGPCLKYPVVCLAGFAEVLSGTFEIGLRCR